MPGLPPRIVLASSNAGKLREIASILEDLAVTIVPQSEFGVADAEETGSTFLDNALLKARHAAAATALPAIADDSGLVVDALGGRPGVYSARYAGPAAGDEANIRRLLEELAGVPDAQRGAAFRCVACYVTPEGSDAVVAEGEWRGLILDTPRGAGGFGYDPVFYVPEHGMSSAELQPAEKNRLSHRGKAFRELARRLRALR